MIPTWADDGNLPPGIHEARWPEIVTRFGGTRARRRMLAGLAAARHFLAAEGCRRIWLDGSFVTDVERIDERAPRDFDACWDIRDADLSRLALRAEEFFEFRVGHPAQKRRWGGEFFPVRGPVPPGGIDQVSFFQTDRAGRPKGIVLLALDPTTMVEVARFLEEGEESVEE